MLQKDTALESNRQISALGRSSEKSCRDLPSPFQKVSERMIEREVCLSEDESLQLCVDLAMCYCDVKILLRARQLARVRRISSREHANSRPDFW